MVKSDKMVRDNQHLHWEKVFAEDGELFGNEPSFAAKQAAELLKKERKTKILELGAGQGRDTIFFAQCGFHVTALEYTGIGVQTIREKARMLGLTPNIAAVCHDVRQPLPFGAETFDACYSHMLYCMAFTTGN
ncbi:conserved hypothetical protein [Thermosinus carboxydivorans Nor1]|uniref:Methyltransferase domain-containing protein n=1 Tax=Thermosinus carboxydivorans Nor1 TaxID=401526 RepID=A1HTL6_9FIRM|nr:class I SAM-dependent methyltransferase [Thermosinus carboxydivorans]EAX46628.1 conserved hypothetical protein [Thermosinus carboxydivorans Nor1]